MSDEKKYKYFIYYIRVYCGKTVAQGRIQINLYKPITGIEDIYVIEKKLEKQVKTHVECEVRASKAFVTNFTRFEEE